MRRISRSARPEPSRRVEQFELVGVGGVVFVGFDVYAANPVALQPRISPIFTDIVIGVAAGTPLAIRAIRGSR